MPTSSDSTPRAQLHERIANHLRKEISGGVLNPGDPLPSEAELCLRFDASRGPVRQALSSLRAEGLISSGRGRRSVVLDTVPSQPFDVLYSFSQWCRNSDIVPGQHTEWMARTPSTARIAAVLDIERGAPVVSLLRLRTMDGNPAMVERLNYPLDVGQHILSFDPDSGSIYERLLDCGVDIYHVTRIIDAIAADAEDARMLSVPEGTALLRTRRRAFTRDGETIEDSDDRYLPSMAKFVLTSVQGAPSPFTIVSGE